MASTSVLIDLLRRILRRLVVASAAIVVVGVVIGLLVSGTAGLWGALLGGVAAVFFCATTVLSMMLAVGREPQFIMLIVLGTWILKMVLLVAMLVVIRDLEFYDRYVLAGVLAGVVIASLVIDVHAVMTARLPNVDPAPRVPEEDDVT